jgi:hypothetical protein
MRLSSWFVFVAVVTTSCSSDLADEMTLVTRISHEVGNLSCEGGALTFDIRAPVARAAAIVMLAEEALDEAACELIISDVTLHDADGALATVSGFSATEAEFVEDPDVECGRRVIAPPSETLRGSVFVDDPPVLSVAFQDRGAVQLFPETTVVIDGLCYDEVGRWEGVSGSYDGRAGTYRWIEDTLQIELVLSES